ncbi:hypothetical protein TrST_g7253 [Triparma strigata]|uniref:Cytidyltransferase-like domain-containing protein n=1 Tax=Triparma strigata TaxID=1606541 RepID=A0A9W7BTM9_9STRA|nr:hypothetical protein TrST_g7253 [Triparma strigata]
MMMIKPARKKVTKKIVTKPPIPQPAAQPVPATSAGGPTLTPRTEMEQLKAKVANLEAQLSRQKSNDANDENIMPILAKPVALRAVTNPSPPGVLRPSSFGNSSRSSPVNERKSQGSSRRTSKSSTSGSNTPVQSRGGVLGAVDFARVGEVEVQASGAEGTTSMINTLVSGSSGAVVDVGRVLPAGHKKNITDAESNAEYFDDNDDDGALMADRMRSRYDSTDTLQSFESYSDNSEAQTSPINSLMGSEDSGEPRSPASSSYTSGSPHPKTPAGVRRLPPRAVDTSTNDIFSPANISQGACLDKFGYAPGEIVNKLFLEHAITEHEDRLIRYLLARDDRKTLENLMMIETGGITKENIVMFRDHLAVTMQAFRDSPMAKAGVGNRLFFDEGDGDEDGGPGSPNRAPERPDTALPKEDESLRGENPQPMIPFSSVIHKVLVKIAMRLRELGPSTNNREKVILVGSGMYNPLHRLHLRMFYLARQFLEGHSRFEVLGGIVSPCHPTAVRQKFRQKPREIIPPKHRLAMARLSVGDSAWLTVDPWEITRRRVLDYLSVLDHVREIIDEAFPHLNIRLIFLTDGNNLPKLSVPALKERKCNCLCICRPMQVDILLKQITKEWKYVAYVLEDTAILSNDLEGINSSRVRSDAIAGKDISKQTNKKVANYIKKHKIADKMGGVERWNREDKLWDFKGDDELDRPYIKMPQSLMAARVRAESEDKILEEMGAVVHKEEFSLLF